VNGRGLPAKDEAANSQYAKSSSKRTKATGELQNDKNAVMVTKQGSGWREMQKNSGRTEKKGKMKHSRSGEKNSHEKNRDLGKYGFR